MKPSIIFIAFISVLTNAGCKLYSALSYGIQPKHAPKTFERYVEHSGAKSIFPDSIFFMTEEKHRYEFLMNQVFKDSQLVFMGVLLNDSCLLPAKSKSSNNACFGEIDQELLELLNKSVFEKGNSKIIKPLTSYGVKRIKDGKPISNAYFDKPVFVFLYSYQYGRYYKKLWGSVQNKLNQNKINAKMMIISIDHVLPFSP